jgi:hypothetical protein
MEKNQLIITEDLVGLPFLEAITKVIEIRVDRRKQYGDTFLEDDDIFFRVQMENKLKRLKLQFEGDQISKDEDKRKTALDSLKDLCNYSLFMIAKLEKQ